MDKQFFTQLAHEVGIWRRDNLIDERQARDILARYGQAGSLETNRNKFVYALSIFGALLIGAGAITFFAANWEAIPDWLKLTMVCSAFVASYAAGFWLRFGGTGFPGVGNALIMLGALLFGASIFLVAQGFHVRANEPALLYLWAAGILPMAYLLSSPGALTIALVALGIGLGWELETGSFFTPYNMLSCFGVYLAFGLLLGALGELHRTSQHRHDLHRPYTTLGCLTISLALYALSSRYAWQDWGYASEHEALTLASPLVQRLLLLIGGSIIVVALYWWKQRTAEKPAATILSGAFLTLSALATGTVFYSNSLRPIRLSTSTESFSIEAIVFNLLLFCWSLGLVALGHHQQRGTLVNMGIWFFGIQLLTRYFELFAGMLPTSLVFTGAGIVLLVGGALLERTRRSILN